MAERPGIISMKGKPLTLVGQGVKVGDPAPDFTAAPPCQTPLSLIISYQ